MFPLKGKSRWKVIHIFWHSIFLLLYKAFVLTNRSAVVRVAFLKFLLSRGMTTFGSNAEKQYYYR